LLGISYLVSHPKLYNAVAPVVIKALLTSLGITTAMFFFTYLPQLAFCALFSGPLAFAAAAVMVLGESYILITFISKVFFLNAAQDRLFDAVLVQQGHESIVSRGRLVKSNSSGFKVLGKSILKPLDRLSKDGVVRYIISLPLNSIPLVGTVFFLVYNGIKAGPAFHARYFQLKNFDKTTREAFVETRKASYTAFGTVSLALNLVPVVGLLFNISSTIGAALWASKMESTQRSPIGPGAQVEREPRDERAESPKDKTEIEIDPTAELDS
jgi:hypothetical protein